LELLLSPTRDGRGQYREAALLNPQGLRLPLSYFQTRNSSRPLPTRFPLFATGIGANLRLLAMTFSSVLDCTEPHVTRIISVTPDAVAREYPMANRPTPIVVKSSIGHQAFRAFSRQ
jgi:hypothetical protein